MRNCNRRTAAIRIPPLALALTLTLALAPPAPAATLSSASLAESQSQASIAAESQAWKDLLMQDVNWSAQDQEDYAIECNPRRDEKREVIIGDLTITSAEEPEKFRCVREVTGNLTIDSDNDFEELVLPFLQKVHGQLKLVGGAWFDGGRFPRLYHVGGRIYVDNRLFSADWQAGSLVSHSGLFEVQAGVFNPLDGFDKLASVGKLELRNHPNDIYGPFNFSGLNGLQKINSDLEINLEWGSSSGPFLVSLAEVGDDVLITLDDGLFFGMEQLQTIGGNLVVHWNSYGYGNTTGLDKLQSVGGNFEWHGSSISNLAGLASLVSVGGAMTLDYATSNLSGLGSLQSVGSLEIAGSSLQSLAGLENLTSLGELTIKDNYSLGSVAALNNASVPAAGTIRITNNWNLSECAARTLVRSLRGDPNWSTWNAAGTYVYGNDDCTFTFYRQFKL